MNLNKKIGPLPVWSYAAIGGLGVIWYVRQRNASSNAGATAANTGIDPATGQSYASELAASQAATLDPTTGLPYSSSGSGAGGTGATIGSGAAPSLATELNDVEAAFPGIATYLGSGGSPVSYQPGGGGAPQPTLVSVPAGTTVYDPTTGQLLTAPPAGGGAPGAQTAAPATLNLVGSPAAPITSPHVPTPVTQATRTPVAATTATWITPTTARKMQKIGHSRAKDTIRNA